MVMGAVWWYTRSLPQYLVMRLRSRYQLWTGKRRELVTATARSLTVIGASPGGALNPFWVQLKQTSAPQSSAGTGDPPSEVTASTTRRAPCRRQTSAIGLIGCSTPVEGSGWATGT